MKLFNPEEILTGFLKGFFSQEKLYYGLDNEFIYTNNMDAGTLRIKLSDSFQDESPKGLPVIIISEGGFTEHRQAMDNRNWHRPGDGGSQGHRVSFFHPLHIHCIARNKGPAKILQAATAQAIISFRKALYELGIDHISDIQGSPPQMLEGQDEAAPSMYDCAISLQAYMEQVWLLQPVGDLEEVVRLSIVASLDGVEYDNNGNIITPQTEWFKQNLKTIIEE